MHVNALQSTKMIFNYALIAYTRKVKISKSNYTNNFLKNSWESRKFTCPYIQCSWTFM